MSPRMGLIYRDAFPALWMAWGLGMALLAHGAKSVERVENPWSRVLHFGPLLLAIALLWLPRLPWPWLNERLYPWAPWQFWVTAGLTAGGLLLTLWARLHMGRNWSFFVSIKRGHELVTTGLFAVVRHPMYSGLLLAFLGSALALGQWRSVPAFGLALFTLWHKLRMEERWLRERFGAAYEDYARRVPALIPRWR